MEPVRVLVKEKVTMEAPVKVLELEQELAQLKQAEADDSVI